MRDLSVSETSQIKPRALAKKRVYMSTQCFYVLHVSFLIFGRCLRSLGDFCWGPSPRASRFLCRPVGGQELANEPARAPRVLAFPPSPRGSLWPTQNVQGKGESLEMCHSCEAIPFPADGHTERRVVANSVSHVPRARFVSATLCGF